MDELELFNLDIIDGKSVEDRIVYKPIKSKNATFLSGTNKAIHQWFRLTPSFGPDLVDIMLRKMNHKNGEVVLDPFCGASTTLIQCKLNNIQSFGFEINPLLYFVGKTCINWNLEYDILVGYKDQIIHKFFEESANHRGTGVEELGLKIPNIHNVHRWWRSDVLKDLLILKNSIVNIPAGQEYIDFFLLGLAAVLVPDLSNVTLGKLQLHFIDRSNDEINVIETYKKHISVVIEDMKIIRENLNNTYCKLYHTDATELDTNINDRADLVITSPPYPNRYSYVWNTRPHLFFLDIFDNPKQASNLDLKTIGGTWGTATSALAKGTVIPFSDEIDEIVSPIVNAIRENDNLMANYVMKYFNLLAAQIVEMDKVLSPKAKVAYVVGNSEIKGVYVATDILLGKIFEALNLGYKTSELMRFRKRNSGVDLYETIVFAQKC